MPQLSDLLTTYRASLNDARETGLVQTGVPGVTFFWDEHSIERAPLLYEKGLVIIGQGRKIGYLGGQRFEYSEEACLVIGVPVPFECEAHGTPEEPLLGIRIDVDLEQLHHLVSRLGHRAEIARALDAQNSRLGVQEARIEGNLLAATSRLIACLNDPMDVEVLGPGAVDEILYRVLRSEAGSVLHALTQHQTAYAGVSRALERMHADYRESLTIDELAKESAMSASSFHRAFKKVTGETPIQYLKKIRLIKAKSLLVFDNLLVEEAAHEVGYASASQFSREFKRYFNVPPSEADTLPYSDAI